MGAVAQLGERLVCNQEATGSIPVSSTNFGAVEVADEAFSGCRHPDWNVDPDVGNCDFLLAGSPVGPPRSSDLAWDGVHSSRLDCDWSNLGDGP